MADNPWLGRRVLNYAHQGGACEAPSSTLFALREAVRAGADGLELDVHMSADGQLVVCHDATVDRTTAGTGAIAAMTLADLRTLDNAHWFVPGSVVDHEATADAYVHRGKAPTDTSFCVATVEEVLEEFPDVYLNFDVKQTAPAVEPYEAALAEVLRKFGRADDVIVASFIDVATEAFHAIAPEISTSLGTNATAAFYRCVRAGEEPPETWHHALQVPATFGEVTVVDEQFVDVAHRAGLAVHVWTINDDEQMSQLVDLGVDGIISDRPTALEGVLQAKGVAFER